MSQTTYSNNFKVYQPGMIGDSRDRNIESFINGGLDDIEFGRGVALGTIEGQAENFHLNTSVLTFSAALIADDDVDVAVNGTSIATVSYGSSSPATLTAVAVAIAALDGVTSATVTDTLEITIVRNITTTVGDDISIVAAVTNGGSGTAVLSTVESTDQSFCGLSLLKQNEDGVIATEEDFGIMTQGVLVVELVTGQDPAIGALLYVVNQGTNAGKFSTTNDATTEASAVYVKESAVVVGTKTLALVAINLP